jgi:predicted permease
VHSGSRLNAAKLLVASQVALSLLLVVGAALFARSLRNLLHLLHLELGFDREHLLSVSFSPHLSGYTNEQFPALYTRLIESVEALPGVRSASVAMCGLISGCRSRADVKITGYESSPGEDVLVQENSIGDGYFSTVGMRLLSGRDFDSRDTKTSPRVAIVNEAMVRRYFQGRNAIGQRFGYDQPDTEIVGIVEDARVNEVQEAAQPMAFRSMRQTPPFATSLEVRTSGDPRQAVAEVTRTITAMEPNLPIERVTTAEERVDANLNQEKVVAQLTSAFGLLALGLACFGLYGVMSYAVARRTPELGIRMALGAPRSHVLWMVFRESLGLVLAGLALGLPLVLAVSRLVSSLLAGITAHDPATLAAAALVLIAVAAIAGYIPARRASRVDPLVSLRYE